MINQISAYILNYVLKYDNISSEMKEAYQYGIEISISSILNITLVLLCSLILNDIFAGLTYLFVFIFLRSFTGGYHATTYFRCNLTMIITFLITFIVYKIIIYYAVPILACESVALISLIPIIIYSPVPNKHKSITDVQKKRSHKLSFVMSSVLLLSGLILYTLKIPIGAMIIMTVTMISVMILFEIFMQRRGYHES